MDVRQKSFWVHCMTDYKTNTMKDIHCHLASANGKRRTINLGFSPSYKPSNLAK